MKKKSVYLVLSLAVIIVAITAFTFNAYGKKKQEENVILAVYVTYGDGGSMFFVKEDDEAFTATIPDELYNINGEKITKDDLKDGNLIKIYGDGMMLESFPGQYPGVTRMEVVDEGKPSDADKYQKFLKKYYREPNPSKPPTLGIEHTDGIAVTYHPQITAGSYEWKYTDKNGEEQTAVKEGKHVLLWKKITDISNDKPQDLVLHFSKEPVEVIVERWESSMRISGEVPEEYPAGEKLELKEKDDRPVISDAEPGYIYRITAVWDNGFREFGFITE